MQAGLAAGEAVPPEFVDLVKPHVQSFDYFLGDGLTRVVELLEPIEVPLHYCDKQASGCSLHTQECLYPDQLVVCR